jgi:hypothetical protein
MITGCIIIGGLSAFILANGLAGRTMLIVHGTVRQRRAGLFRAILALLRMYWFGYSNTLFVRTDCKVETWQEERGTLKKPKSMMIMEIEL